MAPPAGERRFLARCLHGLEPLLAAEVDRAGGTALSLAHREVRFAHAAPDAAPLALRAADDLFLVVGELEGLDHTRPSLDRLGELARALPFARARSALLALRPQARWSSHTVVASFLGRRNYNRYELEARAALATAPGLSLPFSDSRERDDAGRLTVRLHLVDDRATFALRVFDAPLHRRAYKQRSHAGTLHPPLAFAMAMLAGARPGQRVLDPFCGAGTVAIEAKRLQPGAAVVGAELGAARVRDARAHAAAAGTDVAWVRADAGRLPFAEGGFDRVVTNPPWGIAVAAQASLAKAAGETALALASALAPRGRLVVLAGGLSDADGRAFERRGLHLQLRRQVSVFGQHPELLVLSTQAPLTAPVDLEAPFGPELARHLGAPSG